MKKKLTTLGLILTAIVCLAFGFAGCNKSTDDAKYIEEKGTLNIGYTLYEPMNYMDGNKLVGFDTEFAEAVCKELGLKANFIEINWDKKVLELKSKSIDVVWNGMTLKDSLKPNMDFSQAYMDNTQCVVMKKSNAAAIKSSADLKNKTCAVESGSAGESEAKKIVAESKLVLKDKQTQSFTEVKAGQVDFAVVDILLAKSMVGKGSYTDLTIVDTVSFTPEQYGIGLRKNSTLTSKINKAINKLLKVGTLQEIAKKYNLEKALIVPTK